MTGECCLRECECVLVCGLHLFEAGKQREMAQIYSPQWTRSSLLHSCFRFVRIDSPAKSGAQLSDGSWQPLSQTLRWEHEFVCAGVGAHTEIYNIIDLLSPQHACVYVTGQFILYPAQPDSSPVCQDYCLSFYDVVVRSKCMICCLKALFCPSRLILCSSLFWCWLLGIPLNRSHASSANLVTGDPSPLVRTHPCAQSWQS